MDVKWSDVIDSIPTKCSRGHETVDMINFERSRIEISSKFKLKLFCPSCHQKLEIRVKRIGEGRYAATGYDILEKGDLN